MISGACCGVAVPFLVLLGLLGVIFGALGDPLPVFWEVLGVICESLGDLWLFFGGLLSKNMKL